MKLYRVTRNVLTEGEQSFLISAASGPEACRIADQAKYERERALGFHGGRR